MAVAKRPQLTGDLSAEEFARWYWSKRELIDFARSKGIGVAGSKEEIEERIDLYLTSGEVVKVKGPVRIDGLTGPLSGEMEFPPGQTMGSHLRAYMTERCGEDFRFDSHMRAFFKAGNKTLDQAVEHWFVTRDLPSDEIGWQFQYNRFVRDFYRANPGADQEEMIAAWTKARSEPQSKS